MTRTYKMTDQTTRHLLVCKECGGSSWYGQSLDQPMTYWCNACETYTVWVWKEVKVYEAHP